MCAQGRKLCKIHSVGKPKWPTFSVVSASVCKLKMKLKYLYPIVVSISGLICLVRGQECRYVTVPMCGDDLSQPGSNKGSKGNVGMPGKAGPAGNQGPPGAKGDVGDSIALELKFTNLIRGKTRPLYHTKNGLKISFLYSKNSMRRSYVLRRALMLR